MDPVLDAEGLRSDRVHGQVDREATGGGRRRVIGKPRSRGRVAVREELRGADRAGGDDGQTGDAGSDLAAAVVTGLPGDAGHPVGDGHLVGQAGQLVEATKNRVSGFRVHGQFPFGRASDRSSRAARRLASPLLVVDLTVPTLQPMVSAVSASDRSHQWRSTTAARCRSGRARKRGEQHVVVDDGVVDGGGSRALLRDLGDDHLAAPGTTPPRRTDRDHDPPHVGVRDVVPLHLAPVRHCLGVRRLQQVFGLMEVTGQQEGKALESGTAGMDVVLEGVLMHGGDLAPQDCVRVHARVHVSATAKVAPGERLVTPPC